MTKIICSALSSVLILLASYNSYAVIEEHQFATPKQEQLYQQLIQELRCLVCQNQNLADSNADLAKDLRGKTYEMVVANKTHGEIAEFMVARYGDFVLYRPPVNSATALLWFGPFALLALALGFVLLRLKRQGAANHSKPIEGLENAKNILEQE